MSVLKRDGTTHNVYKFKVPQHQNVNKIRIEFYTPNKFKNKSTKWNATRFQEKKLEYVHALLCEMRRLAFLLFLVSIGTAVGIYPNHKKTERETNIFMPMGELCGIRDNVEHKCWYMDSNLQVVVFQIMLLVY